MNARQSTLGEHAANTPSWPPVCRDEWGPTMRRPIPDAERPTLRRGPAIDKRRLIGTGLAPSDFEIVAGVCSPATVREHGYHPDDQHREDHHPEAEDAAIRADLAGLTDTMRQTRTTDDGQSNEPQATDDARNTTRAVADGGEVTATMQEYREAHPDYRGVVNGRPAVLKMTPNGTALIPVEEGSD